MKNLEIKKALVLSKNNYYETHLRLLNGILPVKLTEMELKVLARFLSLDGDIANYRFGPSAKKIVMSNLNLSPAGMSNYITALLNKGFLVKKTDIIDIIPILKPESKEQLYKFRLINIDANNTSTPSN